MALINTIKLSNLANDVFRTLFVRIQQETNALTDCRHRAAFDKALKAFEQAMDDATRWRRSLKDYDSDCDKAWLLLMTQARASAMHFDPKRSTAAEKINEIIDPIGNITKLSYEKEYALIRKALNQLSTLDPLTLKDALVDDIIDNLHQKYDAFMTAQQDENERRAAYQFGLVKVKRNELIEAWNKYASLLELISDDEEIHNLAVNKINQCIAEANAKRPNKSNSTPDIEEIP